MYKKFIEIISFAFVLCLIKNGAIGEALTHLEGKQVESFCAIGNNLYFADEGQINIFNVNNGSINQFPCEWMGNDELPQLSIFSDREQLYCLASPTAEGILLCKIDISEKATIHPVLAVDWETVSSQIEWYDSFFFPKVIVADGGTAFFSIRNRIGNTFLFRIDLTTGAITSVEKPISGPTMMSNYGDGKIFMWMENKSDSNNNNDRLSIIHTQDMTTETIDSIVDISPSAIAADNVNEIIYCIAGNKLIGVNVSDGAEYEIASLPIEYADSALLLEGRYFVVYCDNDIYVCDLNNLSPQSCEISYYSYVERYLKAEENMFAAGIGVNHIFNEDIQNHLSDMLLTGDSSVDVFIIEADTSICRAAIARGYAYDLHSSDILAQAANDMYPAIYKQLSDPKGNLLAIPVRISFDLPQVQVRTLERLQIRMEEIPTNWNDFLDWLPTLSSEMQKAQITLLPPSFSDKAAKRYLTERVLETYQLAFSETYTNGGIDRDTLMELLKKIEAMDLRALGHVPEAELTGEENSITENSIFYPWGSSDRLNRLLSHDNGFLCYPLVMALTEDYPRYLKMNTVVAFINPSTNYPDEAIQFVEALWLQTSEDVRCCTIPSYNTLVERENFAEDMAKYENLLLYIEQEMAGADDVDKPYYTEMIADIHHSMEVLTEDQWAINEEKIKWLRDHDDSIVVSEFCWLYSENDYEKNEIVRRYEEGVLTVDQFVEKLYARIRMMVLEE